MASMARTTVKVAPRAPKLEGIFEDLTGVIALAMGCFRG